MHKHAVWLISLLVFAVMISGCIISVGPIYDGYGDIEGWVYISQPKYVPMSSSEVVSLDSEDIVIASNSAPAGYVPLEDVRVAVRGTYNAKYTDSNGRFVLYDVGAGKRTLDIDHPHFRNPISKTVNVEKDNRVYVDPAAKAGIGYYILIGIDDYLYGDDMEYANADVSVNDATAMRNALRDDNTMNGSFRLLTDSYADKDNIKQAIIDAGNAAEADDYLVFYFSGYAHEEIWGDFIDHIMPYDGRVFGSNANDTVITDAELNNWFRNYFPNRDVTVIIDASYSGTFIDGTPRPASVEMQALRRSGYTVLTSTEEDEQATIEPGVHSVMTQYLLQGLYGLNADQNNDRLITAYELYKYIAFEMERNKEWHSPMLYPSNSKTVIFRDYY